MILAATFVARPGMRWWPPTRDKLVTRRRDSLRPKFEWTDQGIAWCCFTSSTIAYADIVSVDLRPMTGIVQGGWIVSRKRTAVTVQLADGRSLIAVPELDKAIDVTLAEAAARGLTLGPAALARRATAPAATPG